MHYWFKHVKEVPNPNLKEILQEPYLLVTCNSAITAVLALITYQSNELD